MTRDATTASPYLVASVDHALRIATMLQLEGALTVTEVGERLGVARSTAHRLLSTLVHRDFAVQDDRRRYRPGPVLAPGHRSYAESRDLRVAALPVMRQLMELVGETVHLAVGAGVLTRFVAGVECSSALRVGSLEGVVVPAHVTSSGLVLLAALEPAEVDAMMTTVAAAVPTSAAVIETPEPARLRSELAKVRRSGFALNNERSERGIVTVAVGVRGEEGFTAALSAAMPSARFDRQRLPWLVDTLRRGAAQLEATDAF